MIEGGGGKIIPTEMELLVFCISSEVSWVSVKLLSFKTQIVSEWEIMLF